MKRQISEAALPPRKVDLWTPWGVLRLTDRENAARPERKPPASAWRRPGGRPARKRDVETCA